MGCKDCGTEKSNPLETKIKYFEDAVKSHAVKEGTFSLYNAIKDLEQSSADMFELARLLSDPAQREAYGEDIYKSFGLLQLKLLLVFQEFIASELPSTGCTSIMKAVHTSADQFFNTDRSLPKKGTYVRDPVTRKLTKV